MQLRDRPVTAAAENGLLHSELPQVQDRVSEMTRLAAKWRSNNTRQRASHF